MADIIIIGIIIIVVGLASWYVYKSKKSGKKCIGCPYANECASKKCNK